MAAGRRRRQQVAWRRREWASSVSWDRSADWTRRDTVDTDEALLPNVQHCDVTDCRGA